MQTDLVRAILQSLVDRAVQTFVVCPGGRSAPFIAELSSQPHLTVYSGFDERAAAFFALGIARRERRPVAVITTSGTAVGELLPAAMEAYFSGVPLILITADRPKRMRLTGSPQTAFQPHIYGIYAPTLLDIEENDSWIFPQIFEGPCHLNLCFEEPGSTLAPSGHKFIPKEPLSKKIIFQKPKRFLDFLIENKPLAILSAIPKNAEKEVLDFLKRTNIPCYLEGPSNLRGKIPSLLSPKLSSCQSVLRIGSIPTHRLWRDLEESDQPVFSVTELPFLGLTRGNMEAVPLQSFFSSLQTVDLPIYSHRVEETILGPLEGEEKTILSLSEQIPRGSLIYLGNSLPIRHWDRAATFQDKNFFVAASRGLNGIDGQLATFLGLAEEGRENWAIVGDLTFLYDVTAPWFLKERPGLQVVIVVLNNRGGRIFEKMFSLPGLINAHSLSFKPIADLWGWDYLSIPFGPIKELPPRERPLLLEVSIG